MNFPNSIVCTVFEGTYHYGVGALVNSLYAHGYRGILYAGYRGALPPWASSAVHDSAGHHHYEAAEGLSIHFAPQETDQMLANIKPDVIQQVWQHYGDEVDNVFYIDCDIVVKAKWAHFEEWVGFGVALCEDMNSPIHVTHPLRAKWKRYLAAYGVSYRPTGSTYVNGGFVGLNRRYRNFAESWKEIQHYMHQYTGKQHRIGIADRWNMFHLMDQDALNIAKDLAPTVSIMNKEAMDFGRAGYVMSHAAGRRKPWDTNFLQRLFITGARPSLADKQYWHYVSEPIRLFSKQKVRRKRAAVKAAVAAGRFFTKT